MAESLDNRVTAGAPSAGGPRVREVPEGDNQARLVCPDCGFIDYENPKIVVGSVAVWESRILLCKRAIAPRVGYWTLPAGYLELNETTMQGAVREAEEEANASLELGDLLAVYNIPRISQVQLIYRAKLLSDAVAPGPESQAVELFAWDDLPWHDLAFPSVRWALDHHRQAESAGGAPFSNPAGETGDY